MKSLNELKCTFEDFAKINVFIASDAEINDFNSEYLKFFPSESPI